jgi:alpha-ribazole phosphatase
MKIYLIRHGETKEGAEGIILGSIGGELNENGIKYSQNIADFLKGKNIHISKIFTSDLNRAIKTAEIIANNLNVPVEIENLVRERGAGVVEGKKDSDIDWQTYKLAPLEDRKHLGGESFQVVKIRAQQFLSKLKTHPQNDLLVVSHSVFILMLLSIVKGTTIDEELKTKSGNKIFVLDINNLNLETLDIIHSQ